MVTLVTKVLICTNDARFYRFMVQLHVIGYGFQHAHARDR